MSITEMLQKGKGILDFRFFIYMFKLKTSAMQKLFENYKWTVHYF